MYATRGYATRVRVRHPCTWSTRRTGSCSRSAHTTHWRVVPQHGVAATCTRSTWSCTRGGYRTRDGRAYHSLGSMHACTPLAGMPLEYVYVTRVRGHPCTWSTRRTGSVHVEYATYGELQPECAHHSLESGSAARSGSHMHAKPLACTPLAGMPLEYVYVTRVRGHPARGVECEDRVTELRMHDAAHHA